MARVDLAREESENLILSNFNEIKRLRVWYCKYNSLAGIGMCNNLVELIIAGLPDDNIEFVRGLSRLKYLRILHMPKVTDISPLSSLVELEYLSLSTIPSWDSSGKRTVIDSLEPIVMLPKLKGLELFGVCPINKSLDALKRHASLSSVRASGYPKNALREFYSVTGFGSDFIPNSSFD